MEMFSLVAIIVNWKLRRKIVYVAFVSLLLDWMYKNGPCILKWKTERLRGGVIGWSARVL